MSDCDRTGQEQFCEYQALVTDRDRWVCTAHLNEARCFECPHTSFEEAKEEPYPCEDATCLGSVEAPARPGRVPCGEDNVEDGQ